MNSHYRMRNQGVIALILMLTMLAGCSGGGGGGSGNVEINQTGSTTVGVRTEEISVNNCSGKETITTKREEKLDISVEGGLSVEIKVVEASLRTRYARGSSSSIELPAAPGTNMLFVVEWTEEAFFGEIRLDGKTGLSYEVHVSVPRQSGGYDQGCISGVYRLVRWKEAPSPITIYMEVDNGLLEIDPTGEAEWNLFIREKGEYPDPKPSITCKGRFQKSTLLLEGGPGGNARYWTFDMSGFDHDLWMTFCGWDVGGEVDSFALYPSEMGAGKRVLEMKNSRGTLIWEK